MASSPPSEGPGPKRSPHPLILALVAVVVWLGVGMIAATMGGIGAVELSQLFGKAAILFVPLAYLTFRFLRSGHLPLAVAAGAGMTLVGILPIALAIMAMGGPAATASLGADVRVPLAKVDSSGNPWLRHPSLGFEFLEPEARFAQDPEFASTLGNDAYHVYYFDDPSTGAALRVSVAAPLALDEQALTTFFRGVGNSARSDGTDVTTEKITGSGASTELELETSTAVDSGYARVILVPIDDDYALPVSIMAFPHDEAPLRKAVASLRVSSP